MNILFLRKLQIFVHIYDKGVVTCSASTMYSLALSLSAMQMFSNSFLFKICNLLNTRMLQSSKMFYLRICAFAHCAFIEHLHLLCVYRLQFTFHEAFSIRSYWVLEYACAQQSFSIRLLFNLIFVSIVIWDIILENRLDNKIEHWQKIHIIQQGCLYICFITCCKVWRLLAVSK